MAAIPVQTSYALVLNEMIEGQIADNSLRDYLSAVNAEASAAIPFGSWVAFGGSLGDQGIILPAASTAKIAGVHFHTHSFAISTQLVLGSGIKIGSQLSVLTDGHVVVRSETNAAPGDPVFVRYAAGAGGTRLGATRNATVSSEMIDLTGKAKYLTTVTAGNLAVISLYGVG